MYDVIVVGGGPAGLSGALLLGRCNRRVLVCDSQRYRNAPSKAVHAFLSRDGTPPFELLQGARAQLAPYPVEFLRGRVLRATRSEYGFHLTLATGESLACRKLLLATGIVDVLPPIAGLAELWGLSVFVCPFCDAWEVRGAPLAVHGEGGAELALSLQTWSRDVAYFTDGAGLDDDTRARLTRRGVEVIDAPVRRLIGRDGILEQVELADGRKLARRALFLKVAHRQGSDLAEQLEIPVDPRHGVRRGSGESTSATGVYVAGDASSDRMFAIHAAAEGVTAALAIHQELRCEDEAESTSP